MSASTDTVQPPPQAAALEVNNLRVSGPLGSIVEGVSLSVGAGETVAIVGESGSGKSMTAKALSGLLPGGVSATGELTLGGTAVALDGAWHGIRGRRIAMIPQDPFTSLSPRHRCGVQIGMALTGRPRAEREQRVRAIVAEVGLPERVISQYPFQLSGGMRQRVVIAAALITQPEVVIADEATTALDVTTQADILDLLAELQRARGTGLIVITHDLGVAAGRADRVTVLYAGRVAERGACAQVLGEPLHPYTARLLASNPPLDTRLQRLPTVPGAVPRLREVGDACTFASRCTFATDACRATRPALDQVDPGHWAACLRVREIRGALDVGAAPAAAAVPATSDAAPVLSVSGLTKTFGTHTALDAVDLRIGAGEAVAVVGESGSGKTTLARILVGLETADSGTVTFSGAADRARRAQIVFQDPYSALNPTQTVGSALTDALRSGGRDRDEVPKLLEMVGLPADYAQKRPRLLSGGERQRVAIARALALRPQLLICDEAVSSLDVSVQAQILNLISDLRDELGLSVLFISHDLGVVRQVADRIYVLYNGELVEHGDATQVLDEPSHDYTRRLLASVPVVDV